MTPAPATSEYALVDVDNVHPHPRNVRRTVDGVDELAASIKAGGLHQPLVVAPADPDGGDAAGYILVMGHRRHAAAQSLGWSEVPCVIRYDLDTDAKVLEAMLAENMARSDLTPTEEGDAFQALLDLDVKPAKIAKAAGRSAKHVRDRVTVAAQPEKVRQAVDDRQITIANALTLAELADDHELYARVEKAIGTPRFDYEVKSARAIHTHLAQEKDLRAALLHDGFIEATHEPGAAGNRPVDGYRHERLWSFEPEQPDDTLRFRVSCPSPEYQAPTVQWFRRVPVEPETDDASETATPATADVSPADTEEAAQRRAEADIAAAAREAAAQERETAADRRRAYLRQLWDVMLAPVPAQPRWVTASNELLRQAMLANASGDRYMESLQHLDMIIAHDSPEPDQGDPRLDPTSWSTLQLQFALWWCLTGVGCEAEATNFHPEYWEPETDTYLETLRDVLGYELSDIEDALLDTYHSLTDGDRGD